MSVQTGVYVASRASNPERPAMWRELRARGWPIISTWIDEAGPGETADLGELWQRIEREIRGSRGVVLFAQAEDFPLKGALVEVGMAIGAGLPVAVVLPDGVEDWRSCRPVGSWVRHPLVQFRATVEGAMAAILGRE